MKSLISDSEARTIAEEIHANLIQLPDQMLGPWRNADVGNPLLVYTVNRNPSHWTVPIQYNGVVLGRIDISLEGLMMGHSYFYQNPNDLSVCPSTVTRLTRNDAIQQAQTILETYIDAEFSEPVFVIDNQRNQLAWMIEVREQEELVSRVFVTLGYIYQRDPGEEPQPKGLRG